MKNQMDFDAVIIGTGFGGLYALKKLRDELKLKVKAFDKADDVGGTWFWNKYPGALSDTETHLYCYSWDKELLQDLEIKTKYVQGPDTLKYLQKVAAKHDLKKDIQFNTAIEAAHFDDENNLWHVRTETGEVYTARFVISALGILSAPNFPRIEGIQYFKGELYHTSRWPENVSFEGKRVGVIGTGSTGVQVITAIAPQVKHLTVLQRSAQYSVPIGNDPMTPEAIAKIKDNYDQIWHDAKNSAFAFGLNESTTPAMSVSEQEREAIFEKAWQTGGGFRFMFETFSDIALNMEANIAAQNFIKKKIREIVKDPKIAELLTPNDLYAKRPLCDSGYYNVFNRDNVTLQDVKNNPIQHIKENGVLLEDGEFVELDMLICATGFDAVDGNYLRMDLKGRKGLSIQDHWKDGPSSYLAVTTANFPNMFMVLGPNGPFTNLPPSIETQVEWISDALGYALENDIKTIEAVKEKEQQWSETCQEIADATLFSKSESWIFGANIPGKKNTVYFYLGGLKNYREVLAGSKAGKYVDFKVGYSVKSLEQAAC